MNKTKLYAFAGRKRSGKGVMSNVVKDITDGSIVTIANYLKLLCCKILDCEIDELNKIKDDGTIFSLYADNKWFDIISSLTGIKKELVKSEISNVHFTDVRQMLQVIGTDCIRKYKPDWHVECMKKDIIKLLDEGKTVAIDDMRFPNERKAVEELGGECFFMIRPTNLYVSNHVSETSLSWKMFDTNHVIINDKPLFFVQGAFEKYLNHGLENNVLFLSNNMKYITDYDSDFGIKENKLVEEIILQNKNTYLFKNLGVITFTPRSSTMEMEYLKVIHSSCEPSCGYHSYTIYNPLINENLKRYL